MKRRTKQPEAESDDRVSEIAMTLYDVADYLNLNCHYSTVHRLIRKGELPVFRLGSVFRGPAQRPGGMDRAAACADRGEQVEQQASRQRPLQARILTTMGSFRCDRRIHFF